MGQRVLLRGEFRGFGPAGIGEDHRHQLGQAHVLVHRDGEARQDFRRVRSHHHGAQNPVAAGFGQHLDETLRFALGHRAFEFAHFEARQLIGYALLLGARLVQPHAGDLGLGIGGARHHRLGGAGGVERREQRAVASLHPLKSGGMGELERSRDIAGGIDMRQRALQLAVDGDGFFRVDADRFQPIARQPCLATDADQ